MTTDVVKFAFVAGEISPTLFGRTDLTKYDMAMAEARNFFVDYRGGLATRPGFQFGEFVKSDQLPTRMFSFSFSPDLSNSYLVIFGDNYIHFLQDNSFVLEDPVTITALTNGNPAVVTAAAHGLTPGRWVKLTGINGMSDVNGRTFQVGSTTSNTFELYRVPDITPFNSSALGAYTSGGSVYPVYELETDYGADDLANLSVEQYRDLLRITSVDFPIYNLTRLDHTDWDLSPEIISPFTSRVEITGDSVSTAGSAQVVFGVTWVDEDGVESTIGGQHIIVNAVNYPATEGSVSITWTAIADAVYYNVYRSIVSVTEDLLEGIEMGFVGRSYGTKFTDPNIIPDFTRVPPTNYNPFTPGAIERIVIDTPGTNYGSFESVVMVTDSDGTEFVGRVISSDDDKVVNVIVEKGGYGYTAPVVSFSSSGGGSGATAHAVVRPLTGTYPGCSAIFNQRQWYAGSLNSPITMWGSRVKQFSNFSSSNIVLDDDALEFTLDAPAIAPIRHMITTRGGLLAMTQIGVWLLNGGGSNQAITPVNALADPQGYKGVDSLKPLPVDDDLLFQEGKGHGVRMLTYADGAKKYLSEDKSILSNHLFGIGRDLVAWAYQESPFKTVWGAREDGALLAFTIVKAEDVYAWTPCWTKGKFVDLCGLREGTEDRIYVTVQRLINDRLTKFIERMDLHDFVNVEDAWCVDAGLKLTGDTPAGELTVFSGADYKHYEIYRNAGNFTGTENQWIRAGQGIFKILEVLNTQRVRVEVIADPTNWIPEAGDNRTWGIPSGEWTLGPRVSSITGLWHLEGETVSILGDGSVLDQATVVNGRITLSSPASYVIVGLPYTCRAKTLPMIVPNAGIESKRKRIAGIGMRLYNSRGLSKGPSLDRMYTFKERTDEPMGHPTRMINGFKYSLMPSDWSEEGQTYFEQLNPLPANILAIASEIEVGDESN